MGKVICTQPDFQVHAATLTLRLSVVFPALALPADTGLVLDLEVGFTTGVAFATDLVFEMGFLIWVLDVAFALAFALVFGAGCLASPLIV